MGDFSGENVPSNPKNVLFPITHLYHSITQCISYYPNHVQSGWQGKGMVNEIRGSKPLGQIDMSNFLMDCWVIDLIFVMQKYT